jgi:hypothetical protein
MTGYDKMLKNGAVHAMYLSAKQNARLCSSCNLLRHTQARQGRLNRRGTKRNH